MNYNDMLKEQIRKQKSLNEDEVEYIYNNWEHVDYSHNYDIFPLSYNEFYKIPRYPINKYVPLIYPIKVKKITRTVDVYVDMHDLE